MVFLSAITKIKQDEKIICNIKEISDTCLVMDFMSFDRPRYE